MGYQNCRMGREEEVWANRNYAIGGWKHGCRIGLCRSGLQPLSFFWHVHICEKWLLDLSCLCVHLSVHVEGLGSHWMDFHEIWYLRIFWKSIEKIQVSLKSDINSRYLTWRP
jgi:hypothetical protein